MTTSNSAIGFFYHDMGSYSLDKREENICIKISEFHSRWIISFTKMAEVSLRAANIATVTSLANHFKISTYWKF